MKRLALVSMLLCALGFTACSSDSSPTSTAVTPADVTGSWIGTGTDSRGVRAIGFLFAQSDTDAVGPALVSIQGSSCEGAVVATIEGQSMSFSVVINAGDCQAPAASCSLSLSGSATVSGNSLNGQYSGQSSCEGSLTSGILALTRQ